jgi:hypothetical protein
MSPTLRPVAPHSGQAVIADGVESPFIGLVYDDLNNGGQVASIMECQWVPAPVIEVARAQFAQLDDDGNMVAFVGLTLNPTVCGFSQLNLGLPTSEFPA